MWIQLWLCCKHDKLNARCTKHITSEFHHLLKVCWSTIKLQMTSSLVRPRVKPFPLRTMSKDSVECKQMGDKTGRRNIHLVIEFLLASIWNYKVSAYKGPEKTSSSGPPCNNLLPPSVQDFSTMRTFQRPIVLWKALWMWKKIYMYSNIKRYKVVVYMLTQQYPRFQISNEISTRTKYFGDSCFYFCILSLFWYIWTKLHQDTLQKSESKDFKG